MNFNFSIMGVKYSISLTFILIAIILWLIIQVNLLCACNHVTPYEGFTNASSAATAVLTNSIKGTGSSLIGKDKLTKEKNKESFVGANINNGESSNYDLNSGAVDTSKWFNPNLTDTNSPAVKKILERPANLPTDSEMLLFANTKSSPEACGSGSAFSTSSGCLEISPQQYSFLIQRGGNNIPYSEY